MRDRVAFALAGLLLALPLAAQGPGDSSTPRPQFSGQMEVTEALLDVLVTDRDGTVILGLGPKDFHVTEGGKPVEVTGVTFYSNRRSLDVARTSRLGIDPASVPTRRLYVLFFDDQSGKTDTAPELMVRQQRAGRDAEEWVRNKLEPGDLVAVASFDYQLQLLQDWTSDRRALAQAIQRAAASRKPAKRWPSRQTDVQDLPELARHLPSGKALRDATPTLEKALTVLADAAAPIVGRKNLILFTSGFGRVGVDGSYEPEERLYRPMAQALNAANVAVYISDLIPLGTSHPLDSSLSRLARDTGGRPFFELPDFRQPLDQISSSTNGYYLVSIHAEHPAGSSGYQPVEISLVNPEFRVTARKGYRYGPTG